MTEQDKKLLLKDFCARLPYGVKVNHIIYNWEGTVINFNRKLEYFAMEKDNGLCYDVPIEEVLPYLRSMSSMTEEEKKKIQALYHENTQNVFKDPDEVRGYRFYDISVVDWLNENHFDYRGLIPMGLALEAPEGMYKK